MEHILLVVNNKKKLLQGRMMKLRPILMAFSLLVLLAAAIYATAATEKSTLYNVNGYKVTDSYGTETYRIYLDLSSRARYRVNKQEKRIDIFLTNTTLAADFKKLLNEDNMLVKTIHEKWKDNLILSFILGRQPQEINVSDQPLASLKKASDGAIDQNPTQIILDLVWKGKPAAPRPVEVRADKTPQLSEPTKKEPLSPTGTLAAKNKPPTEPPREIRKNLGIATQKPTMSGLTRRELQTDTSSSRAKPRPVIATRLPGAPTIIPGAATAGTFAYSSYEGKWENFINDYEVPVTIAIPLHFSFPPFPAFAMKYPGDEKKIMSAITIALANIGDWDEVIATLQKKAAAKNMTAVQQKEFELAYAEALAQKGQMTEATKILETFISKPANADLKNYATYLWLVTRAASGKQYNVDYDLNHLQGIEQDEALIPWFKLLRAEISLSTGQHTDALQIMESDYTNQPLAVKKLYALRRADAWAMSGRDNEAFEAYRYLEAGDDILKAHPFSLTNYAQSLYRLKKYREATDHYKTLTAILAGQPGQDLAFYASAMSLMRSQADKQTIPLFQNIIDSFPKTEGAYRARLKINDLRLLADREKEGLDSAVEYGNITLEAPLRELREEAAFKQAIALYFKKDLLRTTQFIQAFLHDYGFGKLRRHAEALQTEVLPATIKEMIAAQDYMQALILAEQNRDLLISGRVNDDFLDKVGEAFAGLGFWDRATRVYRYMLDIHKGDKREGDAYPLLIQALYNKEDYKMVEEFAGQYLGKFKAEPQSSRIFFLRVSALRKTGLTDEAAKLLGQNDYSANHDLNVLAAEIFWDLKKYDRVEKYLARVMTTDLKDALPSEVFLRAEALYHRKQLKKALPFYEHLNMEKQYSDQALYRSAQINLDIGNPDRALNLLQDLTEKGISPLWRKMAEETMTINKTILLR